MSQRLRLSELKLISSGRQLVHTRHEQLCIHNCQLVQYALNGLATDVQLPTSLAVPAR